MKKQKYIICLVVVTIFVVLITVVTGFNKKDSAFYSEDIPRQYITGKILSVDENGRSIELRYNEELATVTLNKNLVIIDEDLDEIKLSELMIGETIQCDVRIMVTSEKANSFHDCRQIFVLSGWEE